MKTIIVMILFGILVTGCQTTPSASITVSVLADKTDPIIPKPELSHIRHIMDKSIYSDGRKEFWYGSITNTNVNAQFKSELQASSLMENGIKRKSEEDGFYKSIAELLERENQNTKSYQNSSILKPLITHLQRLKQSHGSDKMLLLYSDILEASDLLNVYKSKGYYELTYKPEVVLERFKNKVAIGDLTGIEMRIIYYPQDMKDNRLFEQMLGIYRELFKDSGLNITVGIQQQF